MPMSTLARGGSTQRRIVASMGVACVTALLAIVAVAGSRWWHAARRVAAIQVRADSLEGELEVMKDRLALARKGIEVERRPAQTLTIVQANHLRRRGLEDPVADLTRSLSRRFDLIPQVGLRERLTEDWHIGPPILLSDRYAYTTFSDGHVVGHLFLEYSVESGRVDWRPLVVDRDGMGPAVVTR